MSELNESIMTKFILYRLIKKYLFIKRIIHANTNLIKTRLF